MYTPFQAVSECKERSFACILCMFQRWCPDLDGLRPALHFSAWKNHPSEFCSDDGYVSQGSRWGLGFEMKGLPRVLCECWPADWIGLSGCRGTMREPGSNPIIEVHLNARSVWRFTCWQCRRWVYRQIDLGCSQCGSLSAMAAIHFALGTDPRFVGQAAAEPAFRLSSQIIFARWRRQALLSYQGW